ncbi:MAG: class I SAM-dependent methyltransferase, partial [Candidatus Omnitrophica bacterium]|nr:class I SAM-dependent methyltransferase [Candidatus Omnitrophota bacterium]
PCVADYTINNPVFLRLKKKFDLKRLASVECVKSAFINERIVEIPFVLRGLAHIPAGGKILDIGCAESILPLQMAGLGYRVTGLDVRRYPFIVPGFDFRQADATAMPFSGGEFDAATCISMLEHVGLGHYEDPRHEGFADGKVMSEIARVLRPGGKIFLTVPCGTATTSELQRTYDRARLSRVLQGFVIEEERFVLSERAVGCLNDHWRDCSEAEAAQIVSPAKTACVYMVRARKV